jgi:hypothetical protein
LDLFFLLSTWTDFSSNLSIPWPHPIIHLWCFLLWNGVVNNQQRAANFLSSPELPAKALRTLCLSIRLFLPHFQPPARSYTHISQHMQNTNCGSKQI